MLHGLVSRLYYTCHFWLSSCCQPPLLRGDVMHEDQPTSILIGWPCRGTSAEVPCQTCRACAGLVSSAWCRYAVQASELHAKMNAKCWNMYFVKLAAKVGAAPVCVIYLCLPGGTGHSSPHGKQHKRLLQGAAVPFGPGPTGVCPVRLWEGQQRVSLACTHHRHQEGAIQLTISTSIGPHLCASSSPCIPS